MLPEFPSGINETHEQWPRDPKTNAPVLWFHWKISMDSHHNKVGLVHLWDFVVDHGAELCPGAAIDLK
jgi:hypothetical protein